MTSIQYKTEKDSRGRALYFRKEDKYPWKRVTKREYLELANAGVKDSTNFFPKPAPYDKAIEKIMRYGPTSDQVGDALKISLPESHFVQQDEPETPAPSPNSASAILREAAGIVEGARNVTHGEKERSFKVIADLWNCYLNGRIIDGRNAALAGVSAVDVAQMMVLLKIARSIQGTPVRDHFLDASAYSAIAGEISGGK